MKLTETQLRKIIRSVISETNNRYDHVGPNGIRLQHGDIGKAPSDFGNYDSRASRMIEAGVWPKLPQQIKNAGEWSFTNCSDGWQFIHTCLQLKSPKTGEIIMAVFGRDRNNSANATNTSYDIYVLDNELIQMNSKGGDSNAGWSSWATKGIYCVNTKQIADALEECWDMYTGFGNKNM